MDARKERLLTVARARHRGLIVVLEDIHDPHNAAAIMRSCDAFGIQEVWLVFEREVPWNPRHVGKSSSSSANKWLTFRTFRNSAECLTALTEQGYSSVATVVDGKTELKQASFAQCERFALWVGNEHRGVSPLVREQATLSVRIPMRGFVESLNVSVASALCMYEITKQHAELIAEADAQQLAQEWMER